MIAWPAPNSSGAAGRHASCAPGGADGGVPVRRSRGYAPLPVVLAPASGVGANTVLAAGAELKNTVALARDGQAFVSGHVGDLARLAAQEAHQQVTDQLLRFHRTAPALLVADRHPGYASRAWARRYAAELGVPVPVSYTHLDVYKRQAASRPAALRPAALRPAAAPPTPPMTRTTTAKEPLP